MAFLFSWLNASRNKILYQKNENLDELPQTNIITPASQRNSFHFIECSHRRIWIQGNITNLFFEKCHNLEIWFFNIFGKLEILRSNQLYLEGTNIPTFLLDYANNITIQNEKIDMMKINHCFNIVYNQGNVHTNPFLQGQTFTSATLRPPSRSSSTRRLSERRASTQRSPPD